MFQRITIPCLAFALLLGVAAQASAQSASLLGSGQRPLTMQEYSWTYERAPERRPVQLHDIVTVLIDEKSVVISEGEMDRKKKSHGTLTLKDWVLLKGGDLIPSPQSNGDPTISGEVDNKLRAEASLETRESLKFRIACHVVDIRPNGNLILEGYDTIHINEEVWDYSFTGEIRPKDILPNNTVLSESVVNKRIFKREAGHVRDGYRRGWLQKCFDMLQPF